MAGTYVLRKGKASFYIKSKEFNIDNGSGTTDDDIVLVPKQNMVIKSIRAIYTEATDTAGASGATFAVGSAVAGTQHAAATALAVSKAVGGYTDATIVAADVLADGMIAVRHTGIAATEGGKYYVQFELAIPEASA